LDGIYTCERCGPEQSATKQTVLEHLPDVLCLHLKRFKWTATSREKVNRRVAFPVDGLALQSWRPDSHRPCDDGAAAVPAESVAGAVAGAGAGAPPASFREADQYNLYAMVNHHGSTPSKGHYTAYCKNDTQDRWFHFNDRAVKPCDISHLTDATQQSSVYLLFFLRHNAIESSL
jgi:ubiquitin C-terminal hydrolase